MDPTSSHCPWCRQSIPEGHRVDSIYCSKRCRQAAWRFRGQVSAGAAADVSLRLAYADPPYPGLADRYYQGHPDFAGEVDHRALLSRLQGYDGWALSTSARALPMVLGLCTELGMDVRVAAWVRGARPGASAWPRSAWEPVVYRGGRRVVDDVGTTDALVYTSRPRTTDPARVVGAKPAAFASWMFALLGARVGDVLDDLFPGSGGILRAWEIFQASAPPGGDTSPRTSGDASALQEGDRSRVAGVDASA